MKIAITLFNNRISPYFDYAPAAMLVELEGSSIADSQEISLKGWSTGQRISYFKEWGVSMLICGGIENDTLAKIQSLGISVIPWVSGEADIALELFLKGRLEAGTMLCRGRRRRWRFCAANKKSAS